MKTWIKDTITYFLWSLKLTSPLKYASDKLTVITFHRVLKETQSREYPLPGLVVTEQEFDWILSELSTYFRCGSLDESIAYIKNKSVSHLPPLAITFDDGQLDNFENALPILSKHNIKATFYIPTDFIGKKDFLWHDIVGFSLKKLNQSPNEFSAIKEILNQYLDANSDYSDIKNTVNLCKTLSSDKLMSLADALSKITQPLIPSWAGMMDWEQINQLNDEGHEIGSHTRTHPVLTEISNPDELSDQIKGSKSIIEKHINRDVHSFCYPNGDQDDAIQAIVRNSGYFNAVTTEIGNNVLATDLMDIKRIDIDPVRIRNRKGSLSKYSLHYRLSCIKH